MHGTRARTWSSEMAAMIYTDIIQVMDLILLTSRARARTGEGLSCSLCSNQCVMGEGEKGYCGLRWNIGGMQSLVEMDIGLLHAYFDPHVTNCCGAWFCPGGTGAGYPRYARKPGPERGYLNLSVFFYGCNFNCLYCQNASHKQLDRGTKMTVEELTSKINTNHRITCICYFGGSPEPQRARAVVRMC